MENLWAPWRAEYIDAFDAPKEEGCIFCNRFQSDKDRDNLILLRGQSVFIIMNRFPYNNGHLLVVPNRHEADITGLSVEEHREIWDTVLLCRKALETAFHPHGYNIGMNLGRSAGAGIDTHCHAHIVPRWNGDTNFMSVFGQVKVISEELGRTYAKLKQVLEHVIPAKAGIHHVKVDSVSSTE
ncbi:MAG: HIT domain-containing protein [Fibrobacterota bacterium]